MWINNGGGYRPLQFRKHWCSEFLERKPVKTSTQDCLNRKNFPNSTRSKHEDLHIEISVQAVIVDVGNKTVEKVLNS